MTVHAPVPVIDPGCPVTSSGTRPVPPEMFAHLAAVQDQVTHLSGIIKALHELISVEASDSSPTHTAQEMLVELAVKECRKVNRNLDTVNLPKVCNVEAATG